MLPPLDPRVLSAPGCDDDDDADSQLIIQAKRRLNTDRNLSVGVLLLLQTYAPFLAQLHQDRAPNHHHRKGADSWHIRFRDPLFDDLRIQSSSVKGVITIRVLSKPFLSICMFGNPQNWQAMLQWLWEHGDKREIARSIPSLDPQKMRTLVESKSSGNLSDQMDVGGLTEIRLEDDGSSICAARRALAMGVTAEGMCQLLLTFNIFEPCLEKSSHRSADVGHKSWDIVFLVSPFRGLRLRPGVLEDVVDIYDLDKRVKSLPMTDSPQSWQAFLEWLWKYGNKRHIAKAEYEASNPRARVRAKSWSKLERQRKPLLHHVLDAAYRKATGKSKMMRKDPERIAKAKDTAADPVVRSLMRRKSGLITSMTASDDDEKTTTDSKAL